MGVDTKIKILVQKGSLNLTFCCLNHYVDLPFEGDHKKNSALTLDHRIGHLEVHHDLLSRPLIMLI